MTFRSISTIEELTALTTGSKLYSPATHDVWWKRNPTSGGPWWEGSGGMYSHTTDFLDYQGPLLVLHVAPRKALP